MSDASPIMPDASLPARTQPLVTGQDVVLRPPPSLPASDPMAILRAFHRHWLLAVGGGLILGLLVGLAALKLIPKPSYTATALVRVKMMRPKILFTTGEQDAEYATFQKTQIDMIKSRLVLDDVLREDDVIAKLPTIQDAARKYPDTAQWLSKELTVESATRSELLQISMNGEVPEDLAKIVNKVVDCYMKKVVGKDDTERSDLAKKLDDLWQKLQTNLKEKRDGLRKQAGKVGSDNKETQAVMSQLLHEQIALAQTERLRTKSELVRLSAEIEVLKNEKKEEKEGTPRQGADASTPSDEAVDAMVANDPDVRQLTNYLHQLSDQYKNLHRTVRNESDPALRTILGKRASAQRSLDERYQQLRPIVAQQLAQQLTGGGPSAEVRDLGRLEGKARVLEGYVKKLDEDIKNQKQEAGKLTEETMDLQTQQEEVGVLAETAKKVKAEVEAMDVETGAPKRVVVVDEAVTPKTRGDTLKVYKLSAMAASGTFALVLAGVTFWELRARRVGSPQEVANSLGIRLVGSLPLTRENTRRSLTGPKSGGRDWLAVMIESIDATRMMLLHASRSEKLQIILITSSVEGEGKTSLACNLAASLARAGRKTLLLDCDLRRSSLHRVFDVPRCPGISEVLLGEASLDSVIHPTSAADLSVIPAGRGGSEAVQVLSRTNLHPLFDELKSRFDFVIIDSAPVLPVVDSLLLSQYSDTVLLSVLCEVSRIPSVQQAYDRLSNLGVRILGAVVAGTALNSYGSGYAYTSTAADSQVEAEA